MDAKTILLIDDDKKLLNVLKTILYDALENVSVVQCDSIECAEHVLQHDSIDLIISDYHLNNKVGIDLLRKYKDIKSILISGSNIPNTFTEFIFFQKPFKVLQFVEAVKSLIY